MPRVEYGDLLERYAAVSISSSQRYFGRPMYRSRLRAIPARVRPLRSLTPIWLGVLVAANSSWIDGWRQYSRKALPVYSVPRSARSRTMRYPKGATSDFTYSWIVSSASRLVWMRNTSVHLVTCYIIPVPGTWYQVPVSKSIFEARKIRGDGALTRSTVFRGSTKGGSWKVETSGREGRICAVSE